MSDFIAQNWVALVVAAMAFAKVVVNLTPTDQDNAVFGVLDHFITAVTGNRKKDNDGK